MKTELRTWSVGALASQRLRSLVALQRAPLPVRSASRSLQVTLSLQLTVSLALSAWAPLEAKPSKTPAQAAASAERGSASDELIGYISPLSLERYDRAEQISVAWREMMVWPTSIDSTPTFVQAERLRSARSIPTDEGSPCLYRGVLREDTCLAFNWGSAGFLKNPIALPSDEKIKTREHKKPALARNWGLPEMVEAIKEAVEAVHASHPKTKRLVVGDLSRHKGGHFPPHLSHQSGRDADIGYYTRGRYQPEYLQRIGAHQLDVERTWTFLHSMLKADRVEYVFMDYRLQKPLYKYMRDVVKLPPKLLRRYISYPRRNGGIIRHLKGHADHMHVRFYAPRSLEGGKAYLRKHGTKAVAPIPVYYKIRRGDSLIKIARRFRVKWYKIMKWNRLSKRSARRLRVGHRLKVGYRTPKLP